MEDTTTLYFGARLPTLDSSAEPADAVVVRGGTILAVGASSSMGELSGMRRVDLRGMTILPGFNDCHMHILSTGLGLLMLDLRSERAPSISSIAQAVGERSATLPDGAWVRGRGYNQNLLAEGVHPTRSDLDPVSRGRPVALWHTSGHVMVANSAALALAGIGDDTPDPDGGALERDDAGRPTGVLKENAMHLLRAAIPPPAQDEARDAILGASRLLASEGITSASDAATGQSGDLAAEIDAYRATLQSGNLKTRMVLMPVIEAVTGAGATSPGGHDVGSRPEWLKTGAAKIFTDGALTTRTAAMREPYADGGMGILTWESKDLFQRMQEAVDLGWPLAVHAIGDRAMDQALAAYESLAVPSSARPRIEHATICDHALIERMARLGAVAVLQPEDIAVLGDAYPASVGDLRAENNSPVAWFKAAGVHIAFSSDRPVTPGHPLVGIRAAVERRTAAGRILGAEHRVGAQTAVRYYTAGSAYATFSETYTGALEVGMRADFVVLDRDITACEPSEITQARVMRTIVDGEIVFDASDPGN